MLIQPYQLEQLRFAYCYRIFLRWRTHRAQRLPVLDQLNQGILEELAAHHSIHILECAPSETALALLLSLKPQEPVAACASKLKGATSKWLREATGRHESACMVSKGYFACTAGVSTAAAVGRYLDRQGAHHGYSERPIPPVFVRNYELTPDVEARLSAKHAKTCLQHHVVLSTLWRQGIFGQEEGESIAARWVRALYERRTALLKVSFLPDHVHIALRVHPAVSPAELIIDLMNLAQEEIWERFADAAIQAGIQRLWQPSAYLGSYGELESSKISKYIRSM